MTGFSKLKKLSFLSFLGFLVSFPLSVTVSQGFAILSFFFSLPLIAKEKQAQKQSLFFSLFLGLLLYLLPFLTSLVTGLMESPIYPDIFFAMGKKFLSSESRDIWMLGILVPAYLHGLEPQFQKPIRKTFLLSSFLLVASGFWSLFIPYRLAPWIVSGFADLQGSRLQHWMGNWAGVDLYLPIGLMNTHLTYGGLLGICFPFVLGEWWEHKNILKHKAKGILLTLGLLVMGLILVFNQSRSVWWGILVWLLVFGRNWIQSPISQSNSSTRFLFSSGWVWLLGILFAFSLGLTSLYQTSWIFQRAVQNIWEQTSTENQRYWIYKDSFPLVWDHPIWGVGAGNFSRLHDDLGKERLLFYPELWVEQETTPRQHAHNDALHFLVVGGVVGFGLFVLFWSSFWVSSKIEPKALLFSGGFVIFGSGFFQCFFLDDEVILPTLAFLGLLLGYQQPFSKTVQEGSLPSSSWKFFALAILSLLLSYTKSFPSWKPDFLHPVNCEGDCPEKTLWKFYNSNSLEGNQFPLVIESPGLETWEESYHWKLKGCLTHIYKDLPQVREAPFVLYYQTTETRLSLFLPIPLRIEVWDRDSFDQDKEYRVHEKKKLYEKNYLLDSLEGKMLLPNVESQATEVFPGNLRFRDFVIRLGKPKDGSRPSVGFGLKPNCD